MPRSPEVKKENMRKKRTLALTKRVYKSYKLTVTSNYERIEPKKDPIESKIHTMKLSGDIPFKRFEEKLGPFEFDTKYFHRKNKKTYNIKYNTIIDNFRISIETERLQPFLPPIVIKITPPDGISAKDHKSFLSRKINDDYSGLRLSSIEYTTDVYFKNPYDVGALFDVLMKNVFIRKQRKKPEIRPESIEMQKKRNRTMKIGRHKIYERGKDKDRIRGGWNREDLNRVRMESTISRGKLKRNSLNNLADLLRSPKFYDINKDIWHFRIFRASESKKLPDELDNYPHETYLGEQLEARKRKVKNLDRSVADDMGFKDFIYDLLDAMKLFDSKWSPRPKTLRPFPPPSVPRRGAGRSLVALFV